jgi:hypothetical protein
LGEANARAAPTTTGLSMPTSTGREASHSSQESHSSGLKSLHRTQRQAAGGVGGEREREVMVGAWGELGKRRKRRRRRSFRIRNGADLSMARERSRAQGWSHEFWVDTVHLICFDWIKRMSKIFSYFDAPLLPASTQTAQTKTHLKYS